MRNKYSLIVLALACHFANAQALTAFGPTTGMSGKDFGSFLAIDHNDILVSSISDTETPGKVYAFNNENGIVQTAVFYPDDALDTDGFGQSLSVSNDLIAIGSRFHNASDGAVYTYKKNNGNWEFLQKITPSDGNPGDNFGAAVKIFGEYLFITATNDEMDGEANTIDRGSVSVYKWSGAEWEFSQKLFVNPMPVVFSPFLIVVDKLLGNRIDMFNNELWVASNANIFRFTLENNNWSYQSYFTYSGYDGGLSDYCFFGNSMFAIDNPPSSGARTLNHSANINGSWITQSYIEIEYFGEENGYQIPTNMTIIGDKIFVGSGYYYEGQPQRKLPIRYYRFIDNQFVFQSMLYGNGPENTDDYFGSVLESTNEYLVVGAPKEGTGKAYTINANLLSNDSFSKSDVKLYPNPTSGIVKISGDTRFTKAEVYAVTGKLLLSQDTALGEISLQKFAAGIYFIRLQTANSKAETFKIIKN
jgi:Secretion system C-terminal sorting domain/FG-GAP repeat